MLNHRNLFAAAFALLLLPAPVLAQQGQLAAVRLQELGPENTEIAARVGTWDVIETLWDTPGAAPKVLRGSIAERRMVGSMLQEIIRPASSAPGSNIERVDYLTFHRVEGRWQYVSMDTRAPVGIMPAGSTVRGKPGTISIIFEPFAIAGPGVAVAGQMLRMEQNIIWQSPDRDVKDQFFMLADGTGTQWLAHRYEYVRRR